MLLRISIIRASHTQMHSPLPPPQKELLRKELSDHRERAAAAFTQKPSQCNPVRFPPPSFPLLPFNGPASLIRNKAIKYEFAPESRLRPPARRITSNGAVQVVVYSFDTCIARGGDVSDVGLPPFPPFFSSLRPFDNNWFLCRRCIAVEQIYIYVYTSISRQKVDVVKENPHPFTVQP